jgi:hypothetical protein
LDFLESVKILARQWRVVFVGIVITVACTAFVASRVEPTYNTSGTMLLFFPKLLEDPETGETNSYISFGNLTVMANVLTDVLNQNASRQRLAEQGALSTYALGLDPTQPTPLITVTAAGPEAEVVPTVNLVMEAIDQELKDRQEQAGAPPVTWITAQAVTLPEEAVPQYGSRIRAAGVVFALGLAGTVTLAFVIDNVRQRRSRAQQALAGERGPSSPPVLEPSGWSRPSHPESEEAVPSPQPTMEGAVLPPQPAIEGAALPPPEPTTSWPGASGASG